MNQVKQSSMRPHPMTWFRHGLLLLLTFITCTIAGVLAPFGVIDWFPGPEFDNASFIQIVSLIPTAYLGLLSETLGHLFTNPAVLAYGLKFSLSVLFIIVAHEAGHYIACRLYKVDATLPYFIPTPPLIGPAGTLGAFMRIVSAMPSRKAVFDIGVAGPIAGFVAMIPVSIMMILTLKPVPLQNIPEGYAQLAFSDALYTHILAFLFGVDISGGIEANPYYFAVWIGLLITAMNLIPSGQLDGGHAMFALFGKRIHKLTGYAAFGVMLVFTAFGIWFYSSPSGILFLIILGVMMRVHHPAPPDMSPLDNKRIAVAILTLIIFVLCFVPVPIKMTW